MRGGASHVVSYPEASSLTAPVFPAYHFLIGYPAPYKYISMYKYFVQVSAWRLPSTQMRTRLAEWPPFPDNAWLLHPTRAFWECASVTTRMPPTLRGDYPPRRTEHVWQNGHHSLTVPGVCHPRKILRGLCIGHYSSASDTAWGLPSTQISTHIWQHNAS